MGLSKTDIENNPRIRPLLRNRAADLLAMHIANPRSAGIFATHQRWLLAHLALAWHFEGGLTGEMVGMYASTFAANAVLEGISSRNTAEAFLSEMVRYGYVLSEPSRRDRRIHWLTVASFAIANVADWLATNLATLDALDGGHRVADFSARPALIGRIESVAARGFVRSAAIRRPGPTFRLFTNLDEGGAIMDRLVATVSEVADEHSRYFTGIAALADFGAHIRLSRSHLSRKLRAAEALGSLGWEGERGKSRIWVSEAFLQEYVERQAAELAEIESGYQHAVADAPRSTV
jgi:hypothetical protein